jgi:hypothetical protein
MAVTLSDDHKVYATIPIVKTEETPDGLLVYGRATDGSVDSDDQIVDPEWSAKALQRWLHSGGNVRVQHNPQLYPAGKGLSVEVDRDGDGGHWVKSLIVEPTAQSLVRHGVLRAYSVGISKPVIRRDMTGKAKGGIVTGSDDTEIAELSLVDRPANRSCGISLAKSAGDDSPWTYGDLGAQLAKAKAAEATEAAEATNPALKAYRTAVEEHRAREPKLAGDTSNGTGFLAKRASQQAWERWDAEGETEGLDGTLDGFARWSAKRQFDAGVGGGVDRDKLTDADFGDPGRRKFPIVNPKDVADAAGLVGHADDPDTVRARIASIAHRKGPEFEARLPDSWGGKQDRADPDLEKNITLGDPNPTGLVPYNLVGATKGAKNCKCGESYDADSKQRRCEGCGRKLPKGNTTKGATVDKGKKRRMVPDDVKPAGKHREPDGDAVEALEHDADMPTDPDSTRDKVPSAVMKDATGENDDPEDDGGMDEDESPTKPKPKGKKPFPGAAPPFGSKSAASPYQVQRMHDALCAAYPWEAVTEMYPSLKSAADAVVPVWFSEQVAAAALKGDMVRVRALAGSAEEADAIAKGMFDPAVLADGRADVHKSFADAYPSAHLTPDAPPQPGQFQRPYISAGHAPLSAGMASTAANIPPASHVPHPDQFDRPLITAGHQAEAPADRAGNLDTGGSLASGSARAFYATASKAAARVAMQAMHDHIAHTTPDMCPMAPSLAVMPPDMGNSNRPTPAAPMVIPKAPGEKTATPAATKTTGPSTKDIRRIVKSAVADAIKGVRDPYETHLAALKAEIDELGAQPDPAQAPLRGVVKRAATTGDIPAPAEKVSLIEQAQRNAADGQDEYVRHLHGLTKSDNPAVRQQAETVLDQLLTKHS